MATTTAPALNPRVIGLAHYAGRALLEAVLARHGATFAQSVVLRAVVVAGGALEQDALVAEVDSSLKLGRPAVLGVVEELRTAGVLESDPAGRSVVRITAAGRELHERAGAETAGISARVYTDIPAEDLAVAGRVLTLITERANAELARG